MFTLHSKIVTYYQSLLTDLEGDLNGNIETLTVMLIHNMAKFLAIELNDIMARPGTDEPSLTEVMMSRSNQELKDIESIYTTCMKYKFTLLVMELV